ncbi:Multidrug resistance protein 1A [Aphelenchoides fujianensis]|nr:Multidrug resistance protein 1A [Aphelenchoides fujianensis]
MKEKEDKSPLLNRIKASYGTLSSLSTFSGIAGEESDRKKKTIGVFSYCKPFDYVLLVVGTIASVIHGAGFPLLSIVLGGMTTVFLRAQNSDFVTDGVVPDDTQQQGLPPMSQDEFNAAVVQYTIYYLILGVLMLVTSYIQIACWEVLAERVVYSLRQNYLKSVLRQEISCDLERVREGMGDKASLFIQQISAFFSGFLVGFFYNWQMALVMTVFTPLLALANAWMGKVTASRVKEEQARYAVAGAIADETFSSMRTVLSCNGQFVELERYEKALEDGRKTGLLKYMYMGIGFSATYIIMYTSYAVAFWFGSLLVVWDPSFDRGAVFTVFFAVMSGSTALGTALPHLTAIAMAKGAAHYVLGVINHTPYIDPYSRRGATIGRVRGAVEFTNVRFSYPLRPEIEILKGVSFSVRPGEKLALVGASGCGKSTIVNLLMRFYDPLQGTVTLDGYDLRELNVCKLRDAIGVVSQEPTLFDGTLEENVLLGNEHASREDVIRCCKMANAYDFIQKLPEGLYTRVGERGIQLSGGQKQRIAIARALVRNPAILLLDEATSALDTESEGIVQQALDKAQEGRTTLIVAHRLSTIKNVDKILVFKEGNIVESGTHAELIEARGLFYEMVETQQIHQQAQAEESLSAIRENSNEDRSDASGEQADTEAPADSTPLMSPLRRQTSQTVGGRSSSRAEKFGGEAHKKKSIASSVHSFRSQSSGRTIREMQNELEESSLKPTPMRKIFEMNRENWPFLLAGLAGCILSGLVTPFFALVYAQIFSVFSEPVDQMQSDARLWSGAFILIGLASAAGFFTSANMLGRCGEALTKKLRFEAFRNLMRQDIGFYDDKRHNTGKLCTRFATDAPNVRYVFTRLPAVISSVVTLIGAIVIGFVEGWKLALILLTIIPLLCASGYFEMKMQFGKQLRDTELLEEAGKVASEAVENIRTVHGLNKQRIFQMKYTLHLVEPFYANIRQAHVYGFVFAFSQSLMFFMYALAFYLGSVFVNDHSMQPVAVYRVFFAIAFCGQSVGQISSFIPDVVKARLAASLLFHLIEFPTLVDSLSDRGARMKLTGNVQLKNVHFAYPTRAGNKILHGLNLQVGAGKTLALVGYSGCGKSTVMALLERFYNPGRGSITIDGVAIRDLNIHSLREQLCIVSQEPVLFDCTIRQNIVYGMQRAVSFEEIEEAARLANIHTFVTSLPQGYDTRVGERGTQLSGGQKQRIAIARALVRRPSILLLDEATSALDAESERIVQEALDNARQNRTCIVIAHRLSTVQNADQIAVINEGRVVEQGTHQELLRGLGIYRGLCQTQILDDKTADERAGERAAEEEF